MRQYIRYSQISLKKAYGSVRSKVLYNFLTEFGIPMKLVRPITKSIKANISTFPVQNDLKQGDAYCHCCSTLLYNKPLGGSRKTRWD
jgi:hypothetical protein